VPELIAKPALEVAPLTKAGITLAPHDPGPITALAVLPGGDKALAKGLKSLGLSFPDPGAFTASGAARLVWTGRDQAFLMGVAPPALDGAAVIDQTDGWAGFRLSGPGIPDALARLVALDLRDAAFPVGRVARSGLNHMSMILIRPEAQAFEIYVFRSMARTAWHELAEVLDRLEARGTGKV
jgi:sarcosine oxidase subunit gamma